VLIREQLCDVIKLSRTGSKTSSGIQQFVPAEQSKYRTRFA